MFDSNRPAPFGELLKGFRTQRHLTQHQLAQAIGMHRNAISRWEQGGFLPNSRGIVLELARQLRLDDAQTRHLLEASLTGLSPHWHVPHLRNPFFTGREEILADLQRRLSPEGAIARTQSYALSGLGGIGKTQIAVEYAYRHASVYSAVFWIRAEKPETIMNSFLEIAEVLSLLERQQRSQQQIVAAVQRWLSTHKRWLLIWDNVEDLELLSGFLPKARAGALFITTRRQALGTIAQSLELTPMSPKEAKELLLRRAKVLSGVETEESLFVQGMPTTSQTAEELVTLLGGLPLALDQAGAYIEETRCSLADYLHRYQQQRTHFLDRRGGSGGDHPYSVTTTFWLACQEVKQEHAAAVEVLHACAFLHPEAIPEDLFRAGGLHLGEELAAVATDPFQLDSVLAALQALSLIQRHPETHTFSLHRLVQAVVQDGMSDQEQEVWIRRVIAALTAIFPGVERLEHETCLHEECERLVAHVLTCTSIREPSSTSPLELAPLLVRAAHYLSDRAQGEQAEPLLLRAIASGEQGGEAYHPEVAFALNQLGILYWRQGKNTEAMPLLQRALALREHIFGSISPQVAQSLNNLGILSMEQSKYKEAERLFKQSLGLQEQLSGPDHSDVATPLTNLAKLYFDQEKYTLAEACVQRAVRIQEQAVGTTSARTAYPLLNLAEIALVQGRYEEAEQLFWRVRSIWEARLGGQHPNLALVLQGQATLHTRQGRDEEAEALYRRALTIQEAHLAKHHPETARSLVGLAGIYEKQGNYKQAGWLLQRAFLSFKQGLGRNHPKTMKTWSDYRRVLGQKEKTENLPITEQNDLAVYHRMTSFSDHSVVDPTTALKAREAVLCIDGPTLVRAFAPLQDHRTPRSRRHPLAAILALSTAAMLSGARSLYAIALWGRGQPREVISALGFSRTRTPAHSSLHEMFRTLDVAAFEEALSTWCQQTFSVKRELSESEQSELLGLHGEELPGIRILATYLPHSVVVGYPK